ncbi:MAG: 2Fe-2S iron-sulfur cluster binding domain-containing protein [Gammaproteobacteria bacterium]|nr:2Fe-2S iron-sulfur cluster binding domain-containing protein [Gammaproteobacteria bacterium]
MPSLTFEARSYALRDNESVLECLTRHGVTVPHSCKSGICQSCMMRSVQGAPPAEAQKGLKEAQQAEGYFLSCSCVPQLDMEVTLDAPELFLVPVTVQSLVRWNGKVARLRLQPSQSLDYRPGQFVNLRRPDGLIRSYSLASVPQHDNYLELHVQRSSGGQMSEWIHDQLNAGDSLHVSTPHGECYYRPDALEQPLLLVGTGTGLAPLYGVIRDALRSGHRGPIWLFHGSRTGTGLYLVDELRALAGAHKNFRYVPCLSGEPELDGIISARADAAAMQQHSNLKGWRVFLCGHPDMVKTAKRNAFLAGAALRDIQADAFVSTH